MESSSSSSSQATTMRRPCFVEDDGLASIAGFSGIINKTHHHHNHNQPFVGPPLMVRRNSLRNVNSLSSSSSSFRVSSSTTSSVFSPRTGRFFDARFEDVHSPIPYFLEACFMCKKPLGGNRDIFMYRGDTPFCSEECRQEQMDIDEASEKKRYLKAFRTKKDSKNSASKPSSSSSPGKNYSIRTGAVAAA